MFTLKFIEYIDNTNKEVENPCNIITEVIACQKYSVHEYEKFIEVIIQRDNDVTLVFQIANATDDSAFEQDLGLRQGFYNTCYVENSNGKTIDVIRKMV